jgi:hypothetical protein
MMTEVRPCAGRMSPFGEIRQIGFVSPDIDRSISYFLDAWNVGPWYVLRKVASHVFCKGEWRDLEVSLALANAGDLQLEIIQQHNGSPSVYLDSLQRLSSTLHMQHIAVWSDDFARTKAEALARGWTTVLETDPGPGESCYVVHPGCSEVCVEISDRSPYKEHVRNLIREVCSTWQGEAPVREGLPT